MRVVVAVETAEDLRRPAVVGLGTPEESVRDEGRLNFGFSMADAGRKYLGSNPWRSVLEDGGKISSACHIFCFISAIAMLLILPNAIMVQELST